jgi:hypothetical protein
MKPFGGRSAFILANGSTTELVEFCRRLDTALRNANLKSEYHSGMAFSENGEASPVLFIGFHDNDADMADVLGKALLKNHVWEQVGAHHYEGAGEMFQIFVTAPN